jgi:hypothetical protein
MNSFINELYHYNDTKQSFFEGTLLSEYEALNANALLCGVKGFAWAFSSKAFHFRQQQQLVGELSL